MFHFEPLSSYLSGIRHQKNRYLKMFSGPGETTVTKVSLAGKHEKNLLTSWEMQKNVLCFLYKI